MAEQEISALQSLPMELGEPIQVCCQQWSRALFVLRLALLTAILVGLIYLGAIFLTDGKSLLAAVMLFALAIGLTFMGFPKIRSTIDQWGDTAVATESGVAYRHQGTWQTLRWDEIDQIIASKERVGDFSGGGDEYGLGYIVSLVYMFLAGHRYTYRLVSTDGVEVNVGGTLSGAAQLMEAARAGSYPFRRQRAQDAFDAGLELYFGDVSINKVHGVSCGDRRYAWDEIGSVERISDSGTQRLKIKPKMGWLFGSTQADECKLPNVDILEELINSRIDSGWEGTMQSAVKRSPPAWY